LSCMSRKGERRAQVRALPLCVVFSDDIRNDVIDDCYPSLSLSTQQRKLKKHTLSIPSAKYPALRSTQSLIIRSNIFEMGLFGGADVKKECDKAAQILKSFVSMYSSTAFPSFQILEANATAGNGKIPRDAITNAKGLAIFTGFRAGMYLAGSGGSGVVVARLADGTWSPPSAFSVRSGGIGLVYGVDVYDCVCVLNTQAAVEAYSNPEMNLGGAVALAAGPIGGTANMKDVKPVWTYTKSRGLYGGLTVDGTVIKEKPDANADFYGSKVAVAQILRGEVAAQNGATKWPAGAKQLTEVLKLAEGKDAAAEVLQEISTEPTPGDLKE